MRLRHIAFTTAALLVTAAAAKSYVLFGPKWGVGQVPYYINPANGDGLSATAVIADIQAAANAWTNQSNAAISMYYMGKTSGSTAALNGKSEVFFRNASKSAAAATTYWWSDGSNRIIEADVVVWDATYRFYTGSSGCSGGVYVQDIFTHEFGHALGLAHSSASAATMYPVIKYCSTAFRSLDDDDLAGIEKLYPAAGSCSNSAPSVTIMAPTAGSTYKEGTSITFNGSASDKEDGNISSKIAWRSSINGSIGSGATFTRSLSAGSHTITASVTDSRGVVSSRQISLSVSSSTSTPPPSSSITLTATKVNTGIDGKRRVDLKWSGISTSEVRVFRNDVSIMRTPNDGAQSDFISSTGSKTYTYTVCDVGLPNCSAKVVVTY